MADVFTDWQPGQPPVPDHLIAGTLRYLRGRVDGAYDAAGSDPLVSVTQPNGAGTVRMTWRSGLTADVTLNAAPFTDRGDWVAGTAYSFHDTFTVAGSLYLVLLNHVAFDLSTDAAAGKLRKIVRAGKDAVTYRGSYAAAAVYKALDAVTYSDGIVYQAFVDLPAGTPPGVTTLANGVAVPAWYPITTQPTVLYKGWTDGKPGAGKTVLREILTANVILPGTLAASRAKLGIAATAATTFSIRKNGTEIGQLTFAANAVVGSFGTSTGAPLGPGDVLSVIAPASQDATAADLTLTLVGTAI